MILTIISVLFVLAGASLVAGEVRDMTSNVTLAIGIALSIVGIPMLILAAENLRDKK